MPAEDKVRRIVVSLYETVSRDWGFASDAISAAFKRETALGPRAKARVVATLHSMIAQHRRLEFALAQAGLSAADRDRPHAHYIAWNVLSGKMSVADAKREMPRLNWD